MARIRPICGGARAPLAPSPRSPFSWGLGDLVGVNRRIGSAVLSCRGAMRRRWAVVVAATETRAHTL